MKNKKKIIGILGGMGPQASAKLVQILVEMSVKEFGIKNCENFPEIVLDSVPVPDFISDKKHQKVALNILQDRVRKMNKMGVEILAISCNTAHLLLDSLQKVSKAPFISMIDEIVKEVRSRGIKKVGLLASPASIESDLFQKVIRPEPEETRVLEGIIRNVIAGEAGRADKLKLVEIAGSLKKKGVEGIILGCTELPLIFPKRFEIPVFDSLEILARALLNRL